MKRIAIVVSIFLAVIILGILVIRVREIDTDVTKNRTKVGVVFNGELLDHSWGQSHYEGIEAAAEELNLEILYRENVPEDERCIPVMEELIDEGCRILVADSFGYGEWELEVAKEHPEIYFYHATGVQESENLATYFGRIYQMRYLTGIVAGLQTKTDQIGYVAAFPISEVNRGINAFTLGVRSVNPEAVVYVEWSNSWTGDEETEAASVKLLDAYDIDVLTMHTDSLKALEEADKRGIWSIGYNIDNSALFPDTYLTAAVWNWGAFYTPQFLSCLRGKFHGRHYWDGAESGVIALAPLTKNVVPEAHSALEQAQQRFEDGTFDVFYGPISDRDGVIRIEDGESMTDEAMLNEFDWYVEGVIICDEE